MAENEATRTVTVTNYEGVHLRAATLLGSLAQRFDSTISVAKGNHVVDAKSTPLQWLSLGAGQGEVLVLKAVGQDAAEAVDALAGMLAAHFEETSHRCHDDASQAPSGEERGKGG